VPPPPRVQHSALAVPSGDIPLILWRGAGKWYGRGQRPSTVYRRSRVTAARKLRFVKQPRLHAGQPDRRLAFNIDAHEQAYAVFLGGEANRATLGIRFSCLFPACFQQNFLPEWLAG